MNAVDLVEQMPDTPSGRKKPSRKAPYGAAEVVAFVKTRQPKKCLTCETMIANPGPMQKYCRPCSEIRSYERKTHWNHTKRPKAVPAKSKEYGERRKAKLKASGAAVSSENKRIMSWSASEIVDLTALYRIALPFTYGYSKNHIYSLYGKGHVFLRAETRGLKNEIARRAAEATKDAPFVQGKVWLDILVQKPNHKGDAVNVVDTVCDGLKVGLGVDDRWFSIRRLDWEIVKENPIIIIGFGQEVTEAQRICSFCGQPRTLSSFKTHRRTCDQCVPKGKAGAVHVEIRKAL